MRGTVTAIAGIDTGIGKTMATGLLGRALIESGRKVITQKIVQTGCTTAVPEDIETHRRLMGMELQDVDRDGTTCPYVFRHPASPQLAAAMERRVIDPGVIHKATLALQNSYETVFLEGAGGLLVPLSGDLLFADYLATVACPVILVTSPRLGSINHTLLSLEACQRRSVTLKGVIYNRYDEKDPVIAEDTRKVIERYLGIYGFSAPLVELHEGGFSPGAIERLEI